MQVASLLKRKKEISLLSVHASTEKVHTENTHAIFISVGFGTLRKEPKLTLSFCITTEEHIFIGISVNVFVVNNDYIYDKSIATHSWSLRRTLLFFPPVLL